MVQRQQEATNCKSFPMPALAKLPSKESKKWDTSLLVGVLCGAGTLLIALLQWDGVLTVFWVPSMFGYLLVIVITVVAIWKWERASEWPTGRRALVAASILAFLSTISTIGTITEYRREHPESTRFVERADNRMHFRFSGGLVQLSKTVGELRAHPFSNTANIDGALFPVTLYAEGDTLYADMTLFDESGKPAIEIKKNVFSVGHQWDKNSDADGNSLEVVNETGEVIFQLVRKSKTELNLTGVFKGSEGWVCFNDNRISPVASLTDCHIKPIFKYPSAKYPGRYAE